MRRVILVYVMPLLAWTLVDSVWSLSTKGLGYEASCDLTASVVHWALGTSEQSATCDTDKGLFCIPYINKCGCYIPGSIFVNESCRARINHPCLGNSVLIDCVENAKCTNETFNYCKCIENYESNEEGTACMPTPTVKEDIPHHQSKENENVEQSVGEVGDSNSNNHSSRNTISVVLLLLSHCIFTVKYF